MILLHIFEKYLIIMERKAGRIPTPLKRNYISKKCFDIDLSYHKNEENKSKEPKILINNILHKRCILSFDYTRAYWPKITSNFTNLLKLKRKKILTIRLDNSLKYRGNEPVFKSITILYLTVLFKRSLSSKIRPV
jgi:hypothetical protein